MSKPQQAPTPFQPPNQAGAASAFQQGAGQLSSIGSQLYADTAPQLSSAVQQVSNNPYYPQALQGAQTAANTAQNVVAPGQLAGASQDAGIAALAGGAAPGYASAATQGGQGAYDLSQILNALQYGELQGAIPGATQGNVGAANQILNTAFDPQSALYTQQYQQMLDQQNAINAMSGVGQTPYGAGLTAQNARLFNTDWQNQQLNRQIAGLGAYDQAITGNTQNLTNLVNSATGNANQLINTGTGALNAGINTGIGALSQLGATTVGANQGASDLATAGLNTQLTGASLPYNLATQQAQNQLSALQQQINAANAATQGIQAGTQLQGGYLGIGQQAAQGAIQAAQANNQANAQAAAGLGNLFGNILGMFTFHFG